MADRLLAVVELGGYPSFAHLYEAAGFEVTTVTSMRKALALVKRSPPAVVVAEFNFQSDFRDRTSNLESLLATLQARSPATRVIAFYESEHQGHLARLQGRFTLFDTLTFPVDQARLAEALHRAAGA